MSKNEHTGDYQQTKPATDSYRDNYDLIFRSNKMIRKHPRNDIVNPPGQIVNPVMQQEKALVHAIKEYTEHYRQRCADACPHGQTQILCDGKCVLKGE